MQEKVLSALVLLLFVVGRLGGDAWFRSLSGYQSYYVEIAFIVAVSVLFHQRLKYRFGWDRLLPTLLALNAVAGFLFCWGADALGLAVPFDAESSSFIFLLVIVGPFIEEALFRHALWAPKEVLLRSRPVIWVTSAVLFSLMHLQAYSAVPESVRGFVAYQAFYTFLAGLFWAWARSRYGTFWVPFLLHAMFNAGFGIGVRSLFEGPPVVEASEVLEAPLEAANKKILVVDMPVLAANLAKLSPNREIRIVPGPVQAAGLDPVTCGRDLGIVEDFFDSRLGKGPFKHTVNSQLEARLRTSVIGTHGYHVLGIVAEGLPDWEVLHLGLSAPPGPEGIRDVNAYIRTHVQRDMAVLGETLARERPRIVQMASSDAWEENFEDLKRAGHPETEAYEMAKLLMGAWRTEWERVLRENPNTLFVVPTGNGGIDWKGDPIQLADSVRGPLPAVLPEPNLLRVSSVDESTHCLSSFANFGPDFVEVAAAGQEISSWTPCESRPRVRFTGTSQASARFSVSLARGLGQGQLPEDILQSLPKAPCLGDKIRYGVASP
jgi:membrane protease YdiL (CAAX protease family)